MQLIVVFNFFVSTILGSMQTPYHIYLRHIYTLFNTLLATLFKVALVTPVISFVMFLFSC